MWRLKNLMPKEQAVGLEGKAVEVGSLKLQVRSTIAQGGFSTVYLARDAASGKQYALKHIICNGNGETLALAKKEVEVMRALRGHPNVVTLQSHAAYGTRDCFLSMDLCEKSLVQVLDSSAFPNENQLLLAFRDVCNAVYAMHCQNPPIAHRDLKAENVLLGGDGQWKLCDFGSTSTNHKCFERADEMGIEEDNIRKHTTPAYRAPEMWDLYQRQVISEKVDIWALGCLLYRMAYLKSAFDGESKLQVLNGNYRIPDTPKYSAVVMGLIKDMLQLDPNTRPDVMQVWQRVNEALSPDCRKAGPDKPPSYQAKGLDSYDSRSTKKPSAVPSRAPPPPPRDTDQHLKEVNSRHSTQMKESDHKGSNSGGGGSPLSGSFWSTQYAQGIQINKDSSSPPSCERVGLAISPPNKKNKSPEEHLSHSPPLRESPLALKKSGVRNLLKKAGGRTSDTGTDGCEIRFDDEDVAEVEMAPKGNSRGIFQKSGTDVTKVRSTEEVFSAFVTEAQHSVSDSVDERDTGKEALQLELEKLKEELKLALTEKEEAVSKYEKLTAICRSQRQELQSLKSMLAASNSQSDIAFNHSSVSQNPPPKASKQSPQSLPEDWQTGHQIGTIWDLEEGFSSKGSGKEASPETQPWQAFPKSPAPAFKESYDDPIFDSPKDDHCHQQHARAASFALGDNWGGGFAQDNLSNNAFFGDNFSATKAAGTAQSNSRPHGSVRTHRAFNSKSEKTASIPAPSKSQPAGWAGF